MSGDHGQWLVMESFFQILYNRIYDKLISFSLLNIIVILHLYCVEFFNLIVFSVFSFSGSRVIKLCISN